VSDARCEAYAAARTFSRACMFYSAELNALRQEQARLAMGGGAIAVL
jgi:hypothetical protein